MTPTFRFMDLPPELREIIYYHAFTPVKPIDTAAIPNTPDRVRIHAIAQLDRQTRSEALHVLFRSRRTEISLHSEENVRRALLCAEKWHAHARGLPQLIFSGRIRRHEFQFFTITLQISDEAPFFSASARPAASTKSQQFIVAMKRDMLAWLESKLESVSDGRPAKLSGEDLVELIKLVAKAADSSEYDRCELAQRASSIEQSRLPERVKPAREQKDPLPTAVEAARSAMRKVMRQSISLLPYGAWTVASSTARSTSFLLKPGARPKQTPEVESAIT